MANLPVLLEHVNLNIPNVDAGRLFYVHCLGGRENPMSTNAWQLHVNLGSSQFHLPFAALPVRGGKLFDVAQTWWGVIELSTEEPLEAIRDRVLVSLQSFEVLLGPNSTSALIRRSDVDGTSFLAVTCPWGNVFHVSSVSQDHKPAFLVLFLKPMS